MKINMNSINLATFFLAVAGIVAMIGVYIIGYDTLKRFQQTRPPAQAATITLNPKPPEVPLCPGDPIEYTFGASPLRAPVVIRIITTLWSVDKAETVVEQRLGDEEVRIWTTLEEKVNDEVYYIPLRDRKGRPITPGDYELRQAVIAEATAPSVFSLAFSISENCGGASAR